jgi:hypothetical protein
MTGPKRKAPNRLKSRIYSALVEAQAAEGLLPLSDCEAAGRGLCIFEKVVTLAPAEMGFEERNPCRVCHARVLAESFEEPPIWWPNCPYSNFKKS